MGFRGWVEKRRDEGKKVLIDTESPVVMTRGKGGWGKLRGQGGINGDGRRLDFGW